MLKMKNSREFFSQAAKKFGTMPFTLRNFENETKAKMGVVECVTHKLVEPFQVLYEKDGKLRRDIARADKMFLHKCSPLNPGACW